MIFTITVPTHGRDAGKQITVDAHSAFAAKQWASAHMLSEYGAEPVDQWDTGRKNSWRRFRRLVLGRVIIWDVIVESGKGSYAENPETNALINRAASLRAYLNEREAYEQLVESGVGQEDAFLAVKAAEVMLASDDDVDMTGAPVDELHAAKRMAKRDREYYGRNGVHGEPAYGAQSMQAITDDELLFQWHAIQRQMEHAGRAMGRPVYPYEQKYKTRLRAEIRRRGLSPAPFVPFEKLRST